MTDDEIIGELVGKYYRMNPATEDMLFDATELRDGMIVLGDARKDLKENPDEGELYNILKYNRWFTVSKIRHGTDGTTRFQATYSDGHKIQWYVDTIRPYYVKKDSIPAEPVEPKYRSSVIVSQYTVRFNQDGTTSIYITETEDGAVTEFVIGDFTQRDVVSHLVNENLPSVNPKAPLFKPVQKWTDPGAKADDGSDYKSAPNLENLQRHDPEWALRNLGQNYQSPSAKSFGWADDLKQQTCLEVMVDPMDASRTHSCILKLIPAHDVHEDGFGMYWRKNDHDQNENVIKEPKTHEKIQIVDIHRCGFTWINRDTTGTVTERVHSCAKPSHDAGEPHVDASGVECKE